jgi:hypothetical protein
VAKKGKKQRPLWWTITKWTLIGIGAREAYLALGPRRQRRRDVFNLAQHRAAQTGKQLIVVGDPDAGVVNRFIGRDYDCGTLCIDAMGCLKCDNQITGRLEDVLPTMESNSAVIYVSAVLEYVDNIDQVVAELQRVSGGDVFVVTVEPWTLTSFFYPGARRQFHEAPPRNERYRWRELWWSPSTSERRVYELPPGAP